MMVGLRWRLAKRLVLVMVPLLGLALEMVPVCCMLVVRRHLHLHLHLVYYYLLPVPPAAVMPCSETSVAAVGVAVNEDWCKDRLSLLIFRAISFPKSAHIRAFGGLLSSVMVSSKVIGCVFSYVLVR